MPRGSRRPASPVRAAPARSMVPARAPAPAHHAPPPAAPQGPGLMGQMAAMAGGVAIGSAVGHAVGNMMGGGGGRGEVEQAAPAPVQQQSGQSPCESELRQFLDCSQNQGDLTMCEGFNQALKDCKSRYVM